jgi:hypothetical protein
MHVSCSGIIGRANLSLHEALRRTTRTTDAAATFHPPSAAVTDGSDKAIPRQYPSKHMP